LFYKIYKRSSKNWIIQKIGWIIYFSEGGKVFILLKIKELRNEGGVGTKLAIEFSEK
jgi:hypothetical protein